MLANIFYRLDYQYLICSTVLTSTIISIILCWYWYAHSRKSCPSNGLADTCYGALLLLLLTTATAAAAAAAATATTTTTTTTTSMISNKTTISKYRKQNLYTSGKAGNLKKTAEPYYDAYRNVLCQSITLVTSNIRRQHTPWRLAALQYSIAGFNVPLNTL